LPDSMGGRYSLNRPLAAASIACPDRAENAVCGGGRQPAGRGRRGGDSPPGYRFRSASLARHSHGGTGAGSRHSPAGRLALRARLRDLPPLGCSTQRISLRVRHGLRGDGRAFTDAHNAIHWRWERCDAIVPPPRPRSLRRREAQMR
jgi:hypothetical protein